MHLVIVVLLFLTSLRFGQGGTINHDKVQPFPQPDPVTISEKAAVKYKPQLFIGSGCVSFPAVDAGGEVTGGLKGTKGTEGCENAPLGSQTYGRSTWYQDKWAMMYSWYFPKNFRGVEAERRHDWASMVIWIDNPAVETPKVLGLSLSQQTLEPTKVLFLSMVERKTEPFKKMIPPPRIAFVGTKEFVQTTSKTRTRRGWSYSYNFTYEGGSTISTRVTHTHPDKFSWIALDVSAKNGTYHDLIMWEQLTDKAREALNSADFSASKVHFNENNFGAALKEAWPF